MTQDDDDRQELERRLSQARRLIGGSLDPLTRERLDALIRDLEEQLRPQE